MSTVDVARTASWVDAPTRAALELVGQGVTDLVGFDVAVISVVVDDRLEVVAVSGSDDARRELLGSRTPVVEVEALLAGADDWGVLRFVPWERTRGFLAHHGFTPQLVPREHARAWHAEDMLMAPFRDESGDLVGLLAVDLPRNGLRPGPGTRAHLGRHAVQAGRAVHVAIDRARLTEQVRLAARARQAVRDAASELSLERLLLECQDDLVSGFRAQDMWIQINRSEAGGGAFYSRSGVQPQDVPPDVVAIAEESAQRGWAEHRVSIVAADRRDPRDLTPEQHRAVLDHVASLGAHHMLFVPLGQGRRCLGSMVLTRGPEGPPWTEQDATVALDVGSDLGHAITHAQAFGREQSLVRELTALDAHKSELVATLSHELKTPLSSILGNLELMETSPDLDDDTRHGLGAIERGARRLTRVVEDLMLLARVQDPGNPLVTQPVDLAAVVDEVVALTEAARRQRGIELLWDPQRAGRTVVADGDPGELDVVVTNLLSNAVKYCEPGGRVELWVEREAGCVVLTVTDDGIGISEEDRDRLFGEFFRSTNPMALRVPGTGLGLSIVERIVRRHGGRIEVDSDLGRGTTFTVWLPAARAGVTPVALRAGRRS